MGEDFSERVRPVQSVDFVRIVAETMQAELQNPSTTFLRTDNTSSAYLPRLELVGGTGVDTTNPGLQIVRNAAGDVAGIRHGGVLHEVQNRTDGQYIRLGSGDNWTRLSAPITAERVSFERPALGGAGPVTISLLLDGSTEAVSATHRTVRHANGHRTYYQQNPSGPGTLVAMRDGTGRPIQLTGATNGGDELYNVTAITGGAHNLNLRASEHQRIQVNPRTGEIRVNEHRTGGAVNTTYHTDGRRVETSGTPPTTTTSWPGDTGFRRQESPTDNRLIDRSNRNWGIESAPDGRITRITTPAAEPITAPEGGSLQINAHGHVVQARADRTSTTILGDGTRIERDAQSRVTQIRIGSETITVARNPSNPAEITQVTATGGTPARLGFPLNASGGQITVDERGNITQRNGNTANTYRTDRTRVVTNTTDGTARTFDANNKMIAVRNRDGEMSIHYDGTGQVSEVRSGNPPVVIAQRAGIPNREIRQINVNPETGAVTLTNERNELISVIRPTRGSIHRDGANRVNEIRRGPAGNEVWGIRYDSANRPVGLTRGGTALEGATNISVNENTGQIQYEQNGRRFTLSLNGSSREERDFNTPHAQIITRNEHNLITEEDFLRANGNRGQRRFHYQMDANGNPQLQNGQPILNRIDFQLPGPCSLVRQADGRWQVVSTDQNVLQMLGRTAQSQPWNANPQLDANGNLTFTWSNGASCHRPADARQDRDVPATPAPAPTRPGAPGTPTSTRTNNSPPTPDSSLTPPGGSSVCSDGVCRPRPLRQPIFRGRVRGRLF
ncbi:MAG: hypothetical protein K2X93_19710 [Candidatus Obscuribacterales bacterium]|nr:hypothetical protein [Candidatus Obscuribacterales bacterium]